ncbi:MAG: short-chain dehydrogenase [Gammaproteobacteria bacterium RIFCSPHIGHO2_12_FULL_37_14]|nr:MAG: short-chain dehydrogenase [Gammaproteobacteria bacterium RIFCSPHIGHO2_12_FULL_37_14]
MDRYKKLFNFDNKVAVVTGASGILGTEFCKALCSFGVTVVCLDREEDSLEKLTQDLANNYGKDKVVSVLCDVSDPNAVKKVVNEIVQQFSKVDILLNNAATKTKDLKSFFSPFTDYSLEVWREVMAVNLDGMFLMAQAIGKSMIERRAGVIIQTASIYSLLGPDQRIYQGSYYLGGEINTPAVYTASKAGVIGLTKHLATLWGEYGVRVNALCPGGVSSGQNAEFDHKYSARVPLGRMAKEIDIVGPMLFLASDASRYVTGQVLFADGGLSAW